MDTNYWSSMFEELALAEKRGMRKIVASSIVIALSGDDVAIRRLYEATKSGGPKPSAMSNNMTLENDTEADSACVFASVHP